MSAASRLRKRLGPEAVMLLHARFCLGDRLLLEQAAAERFGSGSTATCRAGRVVVATQTAEQSLDLDFDVMVTDAAPIDRLIQRAGRLQRHTRDTSGDRSVKEGRAEPVLHVVGPAPSADVDRSWHRAALGNGRFVYTNPAQIWRTLRWLDARGGFEFPRDARAMMEAVFGDDDVSTLPDGIQAAAEGALAEVLAHRSIALGRTIDVARGYVPDLSRWGADDEHDAGTRLGEPTTALRLARRQGHSVEPFCAASDWTAWPLSEVRVRAAMVAYEDEDAPSLRARARETMPDGGERCVLVLLGQDGDGTWSGSALDASRCRVRVHYSSADGLTVSR